MLAGVGRALARDGWQVTVIGRDSAKLVRATAGDDRLHPVIVDYEDIERFAAALDEAIEAFGPVQVAVCWIRSWAPRSLLAAATAVAPGGRLFHVVGTQASDASDSAAAELEHRDSLSYRRVQLGSTGAGRDRRWLTDDEISAAVYTAVT
jgi:hypothetical protein